MYNKLSEKSLMFSKENANHFENVLTYDQLVNLLVACIGN